MFKKKLALIAGAVMLAASLAACGKKEEATTAAPTTEATTEAATSTDTMLGDAASSANLPKFVYIGDDPVIAPICAYSVDVLAANYPAADVSIPCIQVVALDESNPDDVLVYGSYWIYNYKLDGDTLVCESGGHYPGLIHLKTVDNKYEVASFDVVEDGSNYDESAKEIFGDHYDDFTKLVSDDAFHEEIRKNIIGDYVADNKLSITKYQDYGQEPKELFGTEPATEAAADTTEAAADTTEAAPEEAPAEEATTGGDYSMVTNLDTASVESICSQARTAYMNGDWATLSGLIAYPITMYPDVVCNNSDEFIAYMDGKHVDDSDMAEIEKETCKDMFQNGQGICLGTGQIWLSGIDDGNNLKVISVTGIVE